MPIPQIQNFMTDCSLFDPLHTGNFRCVLVVAKKCSSEENGASLWVCWAVSLQIESADSIGHACCEESHPAAPTPDTKITTQPLCGLIGVCMRDFEQVERLKCSFSLMVRFGGFQSWGRPVFFMRSQVLRHIVGFPPCIAVRLKPFW